MCIAYVQVYTYVQPGSGLDRHLCHTGSSGRQGRVSRLLDTRSESADPKTVWSGLALLGWKSRDMRS